MGLRNKKRETLQAMPPAPIAYTLECGLSLVQECLRMDAELEAGRA